MTIDQLRALCQEAARDLLTRHGRPLPSAVVIPSAQRTQVAPLPDFPDDDALRHLALSRFAADRMVPADAPCFGFVAEAELADDGGRTTDVVVVAYGARQRGTWVTAAPVTADGLGAFGESEPLDDAALPFLQPLQHAADLARASDDVLGSQP